MINEANSDLSHRDLVAQGKALFAPRSAYAFSEFILPNSYRADLFILTTSGDAVVLEAKPILRTYEIFETAAKYQSWCNYLWIITNAGQSLKARTSIHGDMVHIANTKLGIIEVDRDTITWRRLPKYNKLSSYSATSLMRILALHEKTAGSE